MHKLLTGKNLGVPIQFKQPLDMLTWGVVYLNKTFGKCFQISM